MRLFPVFFVSLFLLPTMVFGNESGQQSPLLPLFSISPVGELQIRASSNVLLAIAEAEEGAGAEDVASDNPSSSTQTIPWSLTAPRQTTPDWNGLVKDSVYIVGLHWAVIGVLYVMPQSVSGWTDEQKNADYWAKWRKNVQQLVWDKDDFYINYALHPYWGATYYTRARERGLSKTGAFWFSALHSTLYEFGSEAFFEEPSIQDMIVTPVLGSLLGVYFEQVRDRIKQRKDSPRWGDTAVLVVTDPLGGLSYLIDRLFRVDSSIKIQTTPPDYPALAALDKNALIMARNYQPSGNQKSGGYLGLSLQVNF